MHGGDPLPKTNLKASSYDQETVGEVLMLIARWGLDVGRTMGDASGVDLLKGSLRHDGGNERARSLSV